MAVTKYKPNTPDKKSLETEKGKKNEGIRQQCKDRLLDE